VESIGRIGGSAVTFDRRVLGYLIFIARKYDVAPPKFLESIVSAWFNGSSICGKLKIQCVMKTEDRPHFRITCDQHVVTQTKVNLKMLTNITREDLTLIEIKGKDVS